MTTSGDNITKANITASMQSVRDTFNQNIVWHSGNQPFQTDITGGDGNGYVNYSFSDDVTTDTVTASTIVNNFRSYAQLLSRIRSVRLLKWYQIQGDTRAQKDFDQTNITNLNNDYRYDMGGTGTNVPDVFADIYASRLDDFVNSLANQISSHRNNTVTIEEFYCHSNCHGSCHGSL